MLLMSSWDRSIVSWLLKICSRSFSRSRRIASKCALWGSMPSDMPPPKLQPAANLGRGVWLPALLAAAIVGKRVGDCRIGLTCRRNKSPTAMNSASALFLYDDQTVCVVKAEVIQP
jgi:hypothetical protein